MSNSWPTGTPLPTSRSSVHEGLDDPTIKRIAQIVSRHAGLIYHERRARPIRSAVAQRMHATDCHHPAEYIALIDRPESLDELKQLISLLVISKTSFFRNRPQFELLEQRVLPERRLRPGPIHIWSAGCSTGEEAYSIAMVLSRSRFTRQQAGVLASDISQTSLAHAARGVYTEADLVSLQAGERKFFRPDADHWPVGDTIRSLVEFRYLNLVAASTFVTPPTGLWDVIFCRNVLIYFSRETVQEILHRFHSVLAVGGYLFLGASESLFQLVDGFETISGGDAYVYRKHEESFSLPKPTPVKERPPTPAPSAEASFERLFLRTTEQPNEIGPYLQLGQLASDKGALEEALSWYQAASQIEPLHLGARFRLAMILVRLGMDPQAGEEMRRLLFLEGNFALGHYQLGLLSERSQDLQAAWISFRNALRCCSANAQEQDAALLTAQDLSLDSLAAACRRKLQALDKDVPAPADGS